MRTPDALVPLQQSMHGTSALVDPTGGKILDALKIAADQVELENVRHRRRWTQHRKQHRRRWTRYKMKETLTFTIEAAKRTICTGNRYRFPVIQKTCISRWIFRMSSGT